MRVIQPGWRKCERCQTPFRFWRNTARFCSDVCRVLHWREAKGKRVA